MPGNLLKKHRLAPSLMTDHLHTYPAAFRGSGSRLSRSRLTSEQQRGYNADNENYSDSITRLGPTFLAIHAATFHALAHQRHLLHQPHFKELRAFIPPWARASTA